MASVLYAVRTPTMYRAVIVVWCGIAAGCAGLIAWTLAQGYVWWTVLVFGGIMTVLPFLYLWTTGEYRVRGAVRLGPGFIEVPGSAARCCDSRCPGRRSRRHGWWSAIWCTGSPWPT